LTIAHCQPDSNRVHYWQQQVNYLIDVTLHDKDNTLDAFEKIEYINNSPDTLQFIWFHLWPNAYKNDKTAFSNQLLINGDTRFYFSNKEQRGYINRLDFKVNNTTCIIEDHPQYIDVVKVILPTPLPPSQTVTLATPFHVQLPHNFSRGGHDGESYQLTQWYPKPAVYDKNGWHPMPYLEEGEFYSEFGNFDVRITLPKNYVVAATGELQNEEEKEWLFTRNNFSWEPIKKKTKTKGGVTKTVIQQFPPSSSETKTLRYTQNTVHDFAWFADKRFIVNHDLLQLESGKRIEVFTYYTPEQKKTWKNSVQFCKRALQFYSSQIGDYPYSVASAVQGPEGPGGGMEYPTITLISPESSEKELDITITHELGHNWFYGALATNERDHPWMDEGINRFYEHQYLAEHYKEIPSQEKALYETFAKEKLDQPIETSSEQFNVVNYGLIGYFKTSEWMRWLKVQLGPAAFDKAMKDYYNEWQFKHPQPEDFKRSIEASTGKNLDSTFLYLYKKGTLPNEERQGTKVDFLLRPKYISEFLDNNYQNFITVGPAIGANSYDKFMAGIFVTNVKLPFNKFKFFAAPMYAFGSKKFTGIGKIDYSFYPDRTFRNIDLFLNGSTFSYNDLTTINDEKITFSFYKVVPGIRFIFREKDPRSTVHKFIQWKTYFLSEKTYDNISYDTTYSPTDTLVNEIVSTRTDKRVLNQLTATIENSRALYPFSANVTLEQQSGFVRSAFTGNYFFNYPKTGGVNVRLFAGKFFYTGSKTIAKQFETDRYHLNLTGANGYEDYTYSDYFIGRNKFDGLASQQIMMRDGGFKIKTDLLAEKIGKTDDWLVATNLTSSIPRGINPLSLLPIEIPLRVFVDIGTYADAWKQDSELDHFLFDAGLQLSLLKNTVNIYVPLIYSKVYKDYIQSYVEQKGRFWKTISFSIDISNFNLRKIDKSLTF
jgi:peptidase M1-like protein